MSAVVPIPALIIVAMIHAVTAPKQEAVMHWKLEWNSVPAEINSSIQQSVHRVEPLCN